MDDSSKKALWVTEEMKEKIRNCEGRNDNERLKNWAEQFEKQDEELDEDDVREIIRDEVSVEFLR